MVRKFILRLLCFSPLLIFVVFTDFVVDPAYLFDGGVYEQGIAEAIDRGQTVVDPSGNFDNAAVMCRFFGKKKREYDVISIGSSRSFMIRSEFFGGVRFYNGGISGACLNDYIALYQLFYESGSLPRYLLISVDPFPFDRHRAQSSPQSKARLAGYLCAGMGRLDGTVTWAGSHWIAATEQWCEIVSPSYFQASLRFAWNEWPNTYAKACSIWSGPLPLCLTLKPVDLRYHTAIYPDGHFDNQLERRFIAAKYSPRDEWGTLPFVSNRPQPEFADKNAAVFEKLLRQMASDNVTVILFLPPYAPTAYERFYNKAFLQKVELYLNRLAQAESIKLFGSYNPEKFNLTDSDFIDANHPARETMAFIFRQTDVFSHLEVK